MPDMHFRGVDVERRRRRRRASFGALLAGVGILFILASAAQALEIDPARIVHRDQLFPLDDPHYAQNPGSLTEFKDSDSEVQKSATDHSGGGGPSENATEEEPIQRETEQKLVRDCTKIGLFDIAWDVWWSATYNHTLDFTRSTEGAIESCLKTYVSPEPNTVHSIAEPLAVAITNGANSFLSHNPDLYGLVDWLQIVDYYYIQY